MRYREIASRIESFIADTVEYVNDVYRNGKKILVEGVNVIMFDLDFGMYLFVMFFNLVIGGVSNGFGLASRKFEIIIGVVKAYIMCVGVGLYLIEFFGDVVDKFCEFGYEYGIIIGCFCCIGWLDMVALNYVN